MGGARPGQCLQGCVSLAVAVRSFRTDVLPANFSARMGLFSFDAGLPITSGTGYCSYADEVGTGEGHGFIHNLPRCRVVTLRSGALR